MVEQEQEQKEQEQKEQDNKYNWTVTSLPLLDTPTVTNIIGMVR